MKYNKNQNLKDFMHKKSILGSRSYHYLIPYLLFPNAKNPMLLSSTPELCVTILPPVKYAAGR